MRKQQSYAPDSALIQNFLGYNATMIVDLHSHSNCSDGALTPGELLLSAEAAGIELFAITDHDTLGAFDSISIESKTVELITGVEFSTTWEGHGVHIVGLNIDVHNSPAAEGAEMQTQARELRARQIAERLEKRGVKDAYAGAMQYANGSYLGRPHFAQFLVDCDAAANLKQAFKRYLGPGKAGDVKHHWASMPEVCGWIKDSGGTAVLAHPLKYKMTLSKLKKLAADFIAAGGEAIEVASGQQRPEDTRRLSRLCSEMDLLASTGSDFHSPAQPWAALGRQPQLPGDCCPVWHRW